MAENDQQSNSGWHNAGVTDTVIVFVHGLHSSSKACWENRNGTYWPKLVSDDPAFERASIFLAGYYTDVDSGPYDFAQCAREVRDALRHERANGRAPIDYNRIIFVAHSLGGVVVRRLLEENAQEFAGKRVGLALMACPSGGSAYAEVFSALARIYGHKSVLSLTPQAQALEDIDYRFRGLLEEGRVHITGTEACEHHGPFRWKWLPVRLPAIVSVESSSKYFGAPKIIKGTDHSSIVKPDGPQHAVHDFLRNFFRVNWARDRTAGGIRVNESAQGDGAEVLFNVYRPAARPYCIVREVDAAFRERIAIKSVWVHGESGVGKTTLVKRYLDETGLIPLELTLAHVDQFSTERLIREIAETISSRQGLNVVPSHADVVRALSGDFGRQGVVLFLDEVPIGAIDEVAQRRLLTDISALVDAMQKSGGAQLRIVVCSIGRPRFDLVGQKCFEQMELVPAKPWPPKELKKLVETINQAIPRVGSDHVIEEELITAAEGSPRIVKEYYRRRVMMGSSGESELQSLRTVLHALGGKNEAA